MAGSTELLILFVVIAALFLVPRLQKRLEEGVDEDDLGRKTLERLARQHSVERLTQGLPVDILAAFRGAVRLRIPQYEIHRSDQPGVNAVALPGGIVILTTELLQLVHSGEMSEDELAAVLAHEVAHIELGHSRQAEVRERMTKWALAVPHAAGGILGRIGTQVGLSAMRKRSSRQAERDADSWAAGLLALTHYEESALSSFLRKSAKWSSGGGLWSTHPSPQERIEALEEAASEG